MRPIVPCGYVREKPKPKPTLTNKQLMKQLLEYPASYKIASVSSGPVKWISTRRSEKKIYLHS